MLHIGCGGRLLEGWLNTDIAWSPGAIQMDARRRFPFADNTFDFVFSEHMIEHVDCSEGAYMLAECYRVMTVGGRIRITTPNLTTLARLCADDHTDIEASYLDWFYRTFLHGGWPHTPAGALSAFFSFWGHKFIYDEKTLTNAMHAAGFKSIKRYKLTESDEPNLRSLENCARYPEGLLEFESIALEGEK